jgi:hypothetical protein
VDEVGFHLICRLDGGRGAHSSHSSSTHSSRVLVAHVSIGLCASSPVAVAVAVVGATRPGAARGGTARHGRARPRARAGVRHGATTCRRLSLLRHRPPGSRPASPSPSPESSSSCCCCCCFDVLRPWPLAPGGHTTIASQKSHQNLLYHLLQKKIFCTTSTTAVVCQYSSSFFSRNAKLRAIGLVAFFLSFCLFWKNRRRLFCSSSRRETHGGQRPRARVG